MRRLFTGVRAPSTLGTFLRAFTFGHVRQLDAVAARLLGGLAAHAPLLPGADRIALAERAGLQRLVAEHVRIGVPAGVNAVVKVVALVAGMLAAPGHR